MVYEELEKPAMTLPQPMQPSDQQPAAGPVAEAQRILAIDALRGLAILGILAMNIQYFSQVSAAYSNPTLTGTLTGYDLGIWLFTHELFDEKMMAVFSMLYGAGIVLLSSRLESRGIPPTLIFVRRSLWLMLFGVLHAYLLWSGDILFSYAVCGLAVYWFRHWSWKRLLVLGFLGLSVSPVLYSVYLHAMNTWPPSQIQAVERELWQPTQQQIAATVAAYRDSWLGQMTVRVPEAELLEGQGLFYLTLWRSGGLMLIGMALYKTGALTGELPLSRYIRTGLSAFAAGVLVISYGVYRDFAAHWGFRYSFFVGSQFNYWGSLAVAWAWICGIMVLSKTAASRPVAAILARVGRMAFSNYILETLICTTIFYGHGFGRFARFDRLQGAFVVVAVWIFLIIFSQVWLRFCYSGPLEWLWRSLTYCRLQPLRRKSRA
jgi:uncharacterized protein